MTATLPVPSPAVTPTRAPNPLAIRLLLAAGVLALLGLAADLANAPDLTSSGTFSATLRVAVPIGLAGLGGLLSERVGVANIGLEGMMVLGSVFGAWAAWQAGPWAGLVAALLGGAAGGLLHAVATVTFGVDQIISGVAINILGPGVARFFASAVFTGQQGASASLSPRVDFDSVGSFTMPFVSGGSLFGWTTPDIAGSIEKHNWFFVSDLAGLVKGLTTDVSVFTLLALAMVPGVWFLLWRTPIGLRMRAIGEKPSAAESLGVPVYRLKYLGVCLSGAMAGFGGYFLVFLGSRYREGQTGGRGFIGLAAMIFGNWRPFGTAAGAGLFGFADALQLRDNESVKALLLFVAMAGAIGVVWLVARRRFSSAAGLAVVSAFSYWYYSVTDEVPAAFVFITPYLVTLLVLTFASQRLRPPAAVGRPWRKGQVE